MEIFELRYFLGVARFENIHRAAESLNVSPGSLSKAVQRLEDELGVSLFRREGRTIRLTDHGLLLQRKASEIVQLEEQTRVAIGSHDGRMQVVVAGSEVVLAKFGLRVAEKLRKKMKSAVFEFRHGSDDDALAQVDRGEAHLAIVTCEVPAGLARRQLAEVSFFTYVGEGHALHGNAVSNKAVPVEELLKHPFASPSLPLLGRVGVRQSADGWRDDQFPREVRYLTSSLKLLEQVVVRGDAVAYLPDYYAEDLELRKLKVSGCPYSCVQTVSLVARRPRDIGWLRDLFD